MNNSRLFTPTVKQVFPDFLMNDVLMWSKGQNITKQFEAGIEKSSLIIVNMHITE